MVAVTGFRIRGLSDFRSHRHSVSEILPRDIDFKQQKEVQECILLKLNQALTQIIIGMNKNKFLTPEDGLKRPSPSCHASL